MSDFPSPEEKRALQLEELTALLELKRLCDLHGLRYYLIAGTLLGAVRHGGFIPWDDDVDVAMPRADYDKLAKIARRELSTGFFYQTASTEKNCPFFFAKIRKDGTSVTEEIVKGVDMHDGCYVDIFPLDVCPRSAERAERYFKLTRMIYCAIISKLNPDFVCEYTKKSAIAAFKAMRVLPISVMKAFRGAVRRWYTLTSHKGKLCTVDGSYGYPKESYPDEWFAKADTMKFEGHDLPVPSAWDELLTHMYGDYMTPPDESARRGHFIKTIPTEDDR